MQYTAILKRAIPFVLSATAGFVIASFFVPLTAPNFSSQNRSWGKRHDCRQMKREYRQLRNENFRLRLELEDARHELSELSATREAESDFSSKATEPVFKVIPPPPPMPDPPTYRGRVRVTETK